MLLVESKHKDCGSGPVMTEDTARGKYQAICCYCWKTGPREYTRDLAAKAWLEREQKSVK